MIRSEPTITVHRLRQNVKAEYPHLKVQVRTVSFEDLARASPLCLRIRGADGGSPRFAPGQQSQINEWARSAGVVPDTSIYF